MVLYRLPNGAMVGPGPKAAGGVPVRVPCGSCPGCLMERSQSWSLRCRHEASCWDHNVFLTLTYDDEHLPWHGSLDKTHLSKFLKRLRRAKSGVQSLPGSERAPIRFFACGEYGTRTKRAHYHVLLFNVRFEDAVVHGKGTFTSQLLSRLWPFGTHVLGSLTPASAAYTAGYCQKKISGRLEREVAYEVTNPVTGEVFSRVPEFNEMSRVPGIGHYWYQKYKSDLRNGYVVMDGRKVPVPRFYEDRYKADFPDDVDEREYQRYLLRAGRDPEELSEDRLVVKALVANAKKRFFKRESLLEG